MRIQYLRKQYYCIVKLLFIQYTIIILFIELVAACLFESCVENLEAELVGDHISLNCKHDELREFHGSLL